MFSLVLLVLKIMGFFVVFVFLTILSIAYFMSGPTVFRLLWINSQKKLVPARNQPMFITQSWAKCSRNLSSNKILKFYAYCEIIRMQHWRRPATDGAEFWISCKEPAFLSRFSHLQVIQNMRLWCSVAAYVTVELI